MNTQADSGAFEVSIDDGTIILVDKYSDYSYDLTQDQARNLARKITEAIDGH